MLNTELYVMFLRRNFRLTASVAAGAGLISYVLTVLFPRMEPSVAHAVSLAWPDAMKNLFGDPAYAFSNVYGWINLEMFHVTFWAVFGLLAAILAARVVSREREERTLEILLAYPISRSGVVLSRLLATTTLVVLAILPTILGFALAIVTLGEPLKLGIILFATGTGFLLALFCGSISLLASTCGAGQTLSALIAFGIVAVLFIYTSAIVVSVPSLIAVDFVSPFHFYRVDAAFSRGAFDPSVLCLLAYDAIPAATAVIVFSRRDVMA